MLQPRNGQSQSEPKPKCRFTGQRLKPLRPETYRQAVELLAEPEQVPYDHICRLLRVSEHTLKAIEKAESLSTAERKQRLLDKALRIASKAADRVEDQIKGANITQSTVAFGVMTDKALLLLGESGGGVPLQINMWSGVADALGATPEVLEQLKVKYASPGELLHARYNEMVRRLEGQYARTNQSDSPAATDLHSGKESLQK
jgi:hypothetical protein